MDERPGLEERYANAAQSSHLRLNMKRSGVVDLLIAAGWTREGLATAMYRLRAEFDCVKGENRLAFTRDAQLRHQADAETQAARAETARMKFGPTLANKNMEDAAAITAQAEAEAVTARALVLMKLKSLDGVTRALRHYGEQQAVRRNFDASPDTVRRIVGRVLDLRLDPLCPACHGVGFHGGYGTPKVICSAKGGCKGSGRRPVYFGNLEAEAFGRWMLADLDRKLSRVDELMRAFLSRLQSGDDVRLDPGLVSAPMAELQQHLADLRSVQASSD